MANFVGKITLMFRTLQTLRGIFAIAIFAHHFCGFAEGGDSSVSLFLILSGFVLSKGFESKFELGEITYGRFISGRLIRIYPLHVLTLIAAILVQCRTFTTDTIQIYLSNLALIQAWIPESRYYFPGVGSAWFLSALLFCYLAFPALIRIASRMSLRGLATAAGLIITAYLLVIQLIHESLCDAIIYINPAMRLIDFIWGMLLWQLWRRGGDSLANVARKQSAAVCAAIETAAIAFFVAAIALHAQLPQRYALAAMWWLPSMLLIATFAAMDKNGGLITRLLQWRPLVAFGNVSFSFFMLHIVAGDYLRIAFEKIAVQPSHEAFVAILFVATVGAAFAVNRYFEKPIAALWKRYFCR